MPTLEWIGKEKVINHHQSVPFRTLERQYSCDSAGQHDVDNGSENMIIHGDNLEALKALLPRYEGRVKCIYIEIWRHYIEIWRHYVVVPLSPCSGGVA